MAIAVHRQTASGRGDLVHVAETYEAAKAVASRFKLNRKFNADKYSLKRFDVFSYHHDQVVPEFIHQAVPYPDDFLYYRFHKERFEVDESWESREYLSQDYVSPRNILFPSTPYYYVRAETEDEAVERFKAILKTIG